VAQILTFHYRPGSSILHRSDPRLKFLIYLAWNLSLAASGLGAAAAGLGFLLLAGILLGLPMLRIARELRSFIWIFIISWISRVHLSGAAILHPLPGFLPAFGIPYDAAGAREALRFMAQFSAALFSTHVLMSTTALSDLQEGLFRLIRPVNRKFAWRISTMIRIMLTAIPQLLDSGSRTADALKMKSVVARRHPLRYLRGMGISLLRSVDRLAGGYSASLLIRGWQPGGPDRPLPLVSDAGANILSGLAGLLPMLTIQILPALIR
jgi:energy-coupling factor transporter transmembrane protein EcfT